MVKAGISGYRALYYIIGTIGWMLDYSFLLSLFEKTAQKL